ncbi:hypothetical protein OK074_0136 [Actinobacteria bacterium OK074]|nr:hypothetical protein OK074_0136 [Actinobacteria bacterium OK074]
MTLPGPHPRPSSTPCQLPCPVAESTAAADRPGLADRRVAAGYAAGAGVLGLGAAGALGSALVQYLVGHDGSMASAGVALAAALFTAASRLAGRARARGRRSGGGTGVCRTEVDGV